MTNLNFHVIWMFFWEILSSTVEQLLVTQLKCCQCDSVFINNNLVLINRSNDGFCSLATEKSLFLFSKFALYFFIAFILLSNKRFAVIWMDFSPIFPLQLCIQIFIVIVTYNFGISRDRCYAHANILTVSRHWKFQSRPALLGKS